MVPEQPEVGAQTPGTGEVPTCGAEEGGSPAASAEEAQVAQLQADIAALKDRLLRLQADFDNFRKRTQKDRALDIQRGAELVLVDLLPVLDHFEMGLAAAREHNTPPGVLEGFELVLSQFQNVLARHGVEPIPTVGQAFDPHCHEAVAHEPSAEVPAEVIIREVRRGYRAGERLLRPAQVVVSSGPASESGHGG